MRAAWAGKTWCIGIAGCGRLLNCCGVWFSIGLEADGLVTTERLGEPGFCIGALEEGLLGPGRLAVESNEVVGAVEYRSILVNVRHMLIQFDSQLTSQLPVAMSHA